LNNKTKTRNIISIRIFINFLKFQNTQQASPQFRTAWFQNTTRSSLSVIIDHVTLARLTLLHPADFSIVREMRTPVYLATSIRTLLNATLHCVRQILARKIAVACPAIIPFNCFDN